MLNVSSSIIQIDGLSIGSLIVEYTVLFTQVNRLSDSQVLLLTRLGTPSSATTVYQEATGVLTDNPAVLSVGVSKSFDGSGGGASCGAVCIGAAVAASVALAAVLVCIGGWAWSKHPHNVENDPLDSESGPVTRIVKVLPPERSSRLDPVAGHDGADSRSNSEPFVRGCSILRPAAGADGWMSNRAPPAASATKEVIVARDDRRSISQMSAHDPTFGIFVKATGDRGDENDGSISEVEEVFPVRTRSRSTPTGVGEGEEETAVSNELGGVPQVSEVRSRSRSTSIVMHDDPAVDEGGRFASDELLRYPSRRTSLAERASSRSPSVRSPSPAVRSQYEPMFPPPRPRRAATVADMIVHPPREVTDPRAASTGNLLH